MELRIALLEESYKHAVPGDEPVFGCKKISLECVRNSFAAFQVAVKSDTDCLISLTDSTAFSIYPGTAHLRLVSHINGIGRLDIKQITPVPDDNDVLRWDCIENTDYFMMKAGRTHIMWCETDISEDIQPGSYSGTFKVFSHRTFQNEILLEECSIDLTVADITLPESTDYNMQLNLWQHISNIARKHDVRLFSDEHFAVVEKYVYSLVRLGQKYITVIASEIPWSGQRTFNDLEEPTDLFEYSMINVFREKDGTFSYDFSTMDRYIKLCMNHGIDSRIEVFGLCGIWMTEEKGFGKVSEDFPDGIRVRYYDRKTECFCYMDSEPQLRQYIRALYEHFIVMGWLTIVRITADEPGDLELYRKTINIILDEGPLFRLSMAINKAEFTTEFDDIMSEATPSLRCLAQDYDFIRDRMIGREDKTVNWYVCCRPHYPNTFLKSHLLEGRLICLLTYWLGLDGFLRWNYTVWPEKPRERLVFRSPEWLAGDMNFVYPGNDGSPLLSLRYKALLRGVEDFELLRMADEKSPVTRNFIETSILKGTSIQEISAMGYDESEPEKPFSLDHRDYEGLRRLLYAILS